MMLLRFFLLAGLTALAACSSSSSGSPAPVTCVLPAGVSQPVLVYPAPGSSGISVNAGQIIVATAGAALPTGSGGWDAVVAPNVPGGVATYGLPFQPATPPFPNPNTTPSYASPFYVSSTIGQLAAGVQQQVYVNNPNSSCAPYGPIGSFST